MWTKRLFIAGISAILALPAWAARKPYWSTRSTGFAADGADVVAYHSLGANANAVEGKNQFRTSWKGGEWRFANAQNLAAFKAQPEQFAPMFGGYCALSVAYGDTSTGDKHAWDIHRGRLYLNGSKKVRRRWRGNKNQFIKWAVNNWPDVLEF